MSTWQAREAQVIRRPHGADWLCILRRAIPGSVVVFGGLLLLLLVRLIEYPIFRRHRPFTPFITQSVCKLFLFIIGMQLVQKGSPMSNRGAAVANHSSWLDIFALNSCDTLYFVAKSEVSGWPGIGWLARATGTVFIKRSRQESLRQKKIFEDRLEAGHHLLFFPEGTSTDGIRVLEFKSTLFAAFFETRTEDIFIQPVSVTYFAPEDRDPRFYGWWGDTGFAEHLLQVLAQRKQGSVEISYHKPVAVSAFTDRKALAKHCEDQVRKGHSLSSKAKEVLSTLG